MVNDHHCLNFPLIFSFISAYFEVILTMFGSVITFYALPCETISIDDEMLLIPCVESKFSWHFIHNCLQYQPAFIQAYFRFFVNIQIFVVQFSLVKFSTSQMR